MICALSLDTNINSLLWGFAGAGMGPGLYMIGKYFYWSNPNRTKTYLEKVEHEEIELHDERKEMIKNKTGRLVFLLNLVIISISIVIVSVLGTMGIMDVYRPLVIYLSLFFIIQILMFQFIFKFLNKRN